MSKVLNKEYKIISVFKSYTNRFGLQTSRTIMSCSWCKTAYHLKCFSHNLLKLECNFGDLNQLIVPPSWIVKTANKNVFFFLLKIIFVCILNELFLFS